MKKIIIITGLSLIIGALVGCGGSSSSSAPTIEDTSKTSNSQEEISTEYENNNDVHFEVDSSEEIVESYEIVEHEIR